MSVEDKTVKKFTQKRGSEDDAESSVDQMAGAMKALAYPQRIKILQSLSQQGMYFSELSKLTGLKTTALNNNLSGEAQGAPSSSATTGHGQSLPPTVGTPAASKSR